MIIGDETGHTTVERWRWSSKSRKTAQTAYLDTWIGTCGSSEQRRSPVDNPIPSECNRRTSRHGRRTHNLNAKKFTRNHFFLQRPANTHCLLFLRDVDVKICTPSFFVTFFYRF